MTTPRPLFEALVLAVLLPAVAGAVNAVGFFAVGTYTSHMSGAVARVGDELAQGHASAALMFLGMVAAFCTGAAVATAQIISANKRQRARYAFTLLSQAVTLAVFATMVVTAAAPEELTNRFLPVALLCFAMGLQNAMVTKISGAVVRTTHLTGVVTDIGIEAVRLVNQLRARTEEEREPGLVHWFGANAEWKKLRLHLAIFGAFFTGAVVGPIVYLRLGPMTMFIPVAVLLVLSAFDVRLGLTVSHGHLTWHESSDPKVPVHR